MEKNSEPSKYDENGLMSRHLMGTMITRLTNRVNELEGIIEQVKQLADDFEPSPMSDVIREALNREYQSE